jgi:3-dehydroquinate synthase
MIAMNIKKSSSLSFKTHVINKKKVVYTYNQNFQKFIEAETTILLTDKNIFKYHQSLFKKYKVITINAGEKHKNQKTVDDVIKKMIEFGADRSYTIVGIGGGVITDMAGYISAIYMRGIKCMLAPTTILAMVDASIGGKNGIDVAHYKNMVGTIKQPDKIIFDFRFLKTLPQKEWINGFAEIIKHACIKSKKLFQELEKKSIAHYQNNFEELSNLIYQNAELKTNVVKRDEFEKHERMLLNFGHTLGHAVENNYQLPHGFAVAIGMVYACRLSEKLTNFNETKKIVQLIEKYALPSKLDFDSDVVFENMLKDKKKIRNNINYVLLKKIGESKIQSISKSDLKKYIKQIRYD